jgi:hypothetical protein
MGQEDGFLSGFCRDMRQDGADALDGEAIAIMLGSSIAADRDRFHAPIADIRQWASNVEIELKTGAMWTIECLGSDAYHFYPAHVSGDGTVTWLNVWVADDLKLGEMIEQVRKEALGR